MKYKNSRRILFTLEEIDAIHSLAKGRLLGGTPLLKAETLGSILVKAARASHRIKTLG